MNRARCGRGPRGRASASERCQRRKKQPSFFGLANFVLVRLFLPFDFLWSLFNIQLVSSRLVLSFLSSAPFLLGLLACNTGAST